MEDDESNDQHEHDDDDYEDDEADDDYEDGEDNDYENGDDDDDNGDEEDADDVSDEHEDDQDIIHDQNGRYDCTVLNETNLTTKWIKWFGDLEDEASSTSFYYRYNKLGVTGK